MCSVVGYIGKNKCSTFILAGLTRLEYRGYDSAGFACLDVFNGKLLAVKSSGPLSYLTKKLHYHSIDGHIGIGHTRWSTHGDLSEHNAHPHFDCTRNIAAVHNGIIENYSTLKQELIALGHVFLSETDSEVIPHLFEQLLQKAAGSYQQALHCLVQRLEGAYACILITADFPDHLFLIRKKSPLCVGFGLEEMFIASDVLAFSSIVTSVFFLPDESFALISAVSLRVYDFFGNELPVVRQPLTIVDNAADKKGFEHFMLKEIYDQPEALKKTVSALSLKGDSIWSQLGMIAHEVGSLRKVVMIGCGTSLHAAKIAQFFFEEICGLPVEVCLASEFRYMTFFPDATALYIFISQSGETADTLEALRLVNTYNLRTLALTNVATSSIVREAKGVMLTQAGIEVAVASTKAFSTQIAALYWLAHCICASSTNSMNHFDTAQKNVHNAAQMLDYYLKKYCDAISLIHAPAYAHYEKAIFLGKHISYPFALEAALKLKEIAYVFVDCYSSGELKHGPLALVDNSVPVYIFSHQDPIIYKKLLSNAHAVHSRGGRIIAFAYEGQDELCALADTVFIFSADIPALLGPLVMTGVMQLFMYSIALVRGCPIDKPRNLAKSVTVE